MWTNAITVHPWVGERYLRPANLKYRTLILGESNYTEPQKFTSQLVINCVKDDNSKGEQGVERDTTGFCRFSTKIRRVVFGRDEKIHPSEFWNDVAFYNFVQSLVGLNARERPTPQMWQNSTSAFGEVVNVLNPERVLVLGKANWRNLLSHFPHRFDGQYAGELTLGNNTVKIGYVNHPSSSLSYAKWHPIAEAFLNM